MFEREIQKAKEQLVHLVMSGLPYLYWFEIEEHKTLQPFYKQFFSAEVRWWIFEQQMLRHSNPRFDYTQEHIAYHAQQLDHYALECARFDHQDLHATVDLAVKTRFNYIIRPRTTLRWFVYRGEPTKPLQEVLLRLNYFSDYQYLLQGFRHWAEEKKVDTAPQEVRQDIVSVVEFDRILHSVDNEAIFDLSPGQFIELLQPLFDLFSEVYGGMHDMPRGVIPTAALVIFLDDKGITPIAQELEELLKERHKRYLSRQDFASVLSDIISKLEQNPEYQPGDAEKTSDGMNFDKTTESMVS